MLELTLFYCYMLLVKNVIQHQDEAKIMQKTAHKLSGLNKWPPVAEMSRYDTITPRAM